MHRSLLALLCLFAASATAQPRPTTERLATGFQRDGYRTGHDTTDGPRDVTVRVGDLTVRRLVVYPALLDTLRSPTRRFLITRDGREIADWPDPYNGAWDEGFDVLLGDLDGDGTREVLVVQHLGTGNGLGVATWEVRVIPETGGEAPLRFVTADYGPSGLVVRRRGGLRLMAATWEGGREAGRGEGLYYTARFYHYAAGALVPAPPILQRRYLYAFQTLRGREMAAGRYHPDRWIARSTRRVAQDPGLPQGRRLGGETVVTVEAMPGEGYRVRAADGRAEERQVWLMGDAATGMLYPFGYRPLGAPAAWPQGLPLRLDAYQSPFDEAARAYVLWLGR